MSVAMVINQMCGKNYFASDKIWSRERHVHFNKDGKHYKFLCVLPLGRKNLSRVVLIDDHKNHQEVNPGNVYRIAEFKGEIDDIELDRALNFLKDKLKDCDDVRPVLSARQEEADSWAKMSLWKHQDVRILFASKWLEIV
jgi:TFIIF-interacting CTD phosphatase-like protein